MYVHRLFLMTDLLRLLYIAYVIFAVKYCIKVFIPILNYIDDTKNLLQSFDNL